MSVLKNNMLSLTWMCFASAPSARPLSRHSNDNSPGHSPGRSSSMRSHTLFARHSSLLTRHSNQLTVHSSQLTALALLSVRGSKRVHPRVSLPRRTPYALCLDRVTMKSPNIRITGNEQDSLFHQTLSALTCSGISSILGSRRSKRVPRYQRLYGRGLVSICGRASKLRTSVDTKRRASQILGSSR